MTLLMYEKIPPIHGSFENARMQAISTRESVVAHALRREDYPGFQVLDLFDRLVGKNDCAQEKPRRLPAQQAGQPAPQASP